MHLGAQQQLVDDHGVLVGALPQVDRREVKAEYAHLALQAAQAALGERAGALRLQAARDQLQVRGKLGGDG